jgi:MFS family permease
MTITGVGMMAQTSSVNTFIQTHSAPHMRGRAISYFVMSYQGIIPVGSLLIGVLANSVGPRMAVAAEGVIGIIATLIFILYRSRINEAETGEKVKKLALH